MAQVFFVSKKGTYKREMEDRYPQISSCLKGDTFLDIFQAMIFLVSLFLNFRAFLGGVFFLKGKLSQRVIITQRIHGTGIFTYIDYPGKCR